MKPLSVTLTRRYSLPALHTLAGPGFTTTQNAQVFGACSRLHGHEYVLEVTVSGQVDPYSGFLLSRERLDQVVEQYLLVPYRGTNLSESFTFTTGEALAADFYRLLAPQLPSGIALHSVTVHETAKNSFTAR